jgi:hypothetical protein
MSAVRRERTFVDRMLWNFFNSRQVHNLKVVAYSCKQISS